jgi:probable F420-dependent oxidoreductase
MAIDIARVGIWTNTLDSHPTAVAQEACRELESLGFTTLWIPEAIGRDPFVAAANYLAGTTRLKVATGIANVYARDAMTMAACQKTLAEAYPGRFLLGLGVSSPQLVQNLRKHSYDKPLSYLASYLEAMDKAMFSAVGPAEDPGRVLAALGPKMLALSGAQADGAHPYLATPDHTKTAREIIGPSKLLAPEQMVVLETDPAKARQIGRSAVGFYMRAPGYLANLRRLGFSDDDWADPKNPSDRLIDGVVAWGDLDAIARRVREQHDAGADHVCIQVLRADREIPVADWRELATALL